MTAAMVSIDELKSLYESYISSLLSNKGFSVIKSGNSEGGETFLLAYSSAPPNELLLTIKCKYWYREIEVNDVQEVFTAQHLFNSPYSAVISNQNFDSKALEISKKLGVITVTAGLDAWKGTSWIYGPESFPTKSIKQEFNWSRFLSGIHNASCAPCVVVPLKRNTDFRRFELIISKISPHGTQIVNTKKMTRSSDLATVTSGLVQGSVLIISVENLQNEMISLLLEAMNSFSIQVDIGSGSSARTAKIELPAFGVVLIGGEDTFFHRYMPSQASIMWAKEDDITNVYGDLLKKRNHFISDSKAQEIALARVKQQIPPGMFMRYECTNPETDIIDMKTLYVLKVRAIKKIPWMSEESVTHFEVHLDPETGDVLSLKEL